MTSPYKSNEYEGRASTYLDQLRMAAHIEEALEQLGLTSYQYAQMIGAHPHVVSRWLDLGPSPRSDYFYRVCEDLGLDPTEYGAPPSDKQIEQLRSEVDDDKRQSEITSWTRSTYQLTIRQQIGDAIAHERMMQRLTMEDVAKRAEMCYSSLWSIEKGKSTPTAKSIKALCGVLGMDPAPLLELRETARRCKRTAGGKAASLAGVPRNDYKR